MERGRPTKMDQTGRKVEEIKHYVQRDLCLQEKNKNYYGTFVGCYFV